MKNPLFNQLALIFYSKKTPYHLQKAFAQSYSWTRNLKNTLSFTKSATKSLRTESISLKMRSLTTVKRLNLFFRGRIIGSFTSTFTNMTLVNKYRMGRFEEAKQEAEYHLI